jgi:intracellular multiplication protein IcmO
MVLNYRKHQPNFNKEILKDARGDFEQMRDKLRKKDFAALFLCACGGLIIVHSWMLQVAEMVFAFCLIYYYWLHKRPESLPFKMPKSANKIDPNNKAPGGGGARPAEGILYIGNDDLTKEEVWFNNDDARTHILYLGTTGAGKTEGLKALTTNALGWASGFVYIDGKADTALWGSISALARRYGRDDDLLVLNYMTGNSDGDSISNSINPFALGSASYLTNLLVSLMPEVQGDNAMWKDRAVALMSALMPVLTWRRDKLEVPLSIDSIRDELVLANVIRWSRDKNVPPKNRKEIVSYLNTLPGYRDEFFNDDGSPRSAANGQPNDTSTMEQQHGYLTMQFTKQLQSLAGDYGYIFLDPHADIDIMDVVLNRRILVVLIPALEKSADEAANLGKIIAALLKGMMGATLGSSVEGDTDLALENRPTTAPTPFMTIFDEVGYYATTGMAVMAAQARSLGFSMIFAGQDLPALEKRIKEEARSITANCNIKIFGKLEDPTQTKEFFEKTVGKAMVLESGGRKKVKTMFGSNIYDDSDSYTLQARDKADYDDLKGYSAGEAVVCFGDHLVKAKMFYSDPGKIKSLRVNRFVAMEHPDPTGKRGSRDVEAVLERFRDRNWSAETAQTVQEPSPLLKNLAEGFAIARDQQRGLVESGAFALTWMSWQEGHLKKEDIPDPSIEQKALNASAESLPAPNASEKITAPVSPTTDTVKEPVLTIDSQTDAKPPSILSAPQEENAPAHQEKVEKGTEETLSWASLIGEEPATQKSTATPSSPKISDDTADVSETHQESIRKGTEGSLSWDALIADGESKATAKSPSPAPASIPQSSFGFGGYGTSGIGYASPHLSPPVAVPQSTAPPAPAKTEKDIEKSIEDGETLKWEDLI